MNSYDRWRHTGENHNNKIIIQNLGAYNSEHKDRGYFIICKCGTGMVVPYRMRTSIKKCPYCKTK